MSISPAKITLRSEQAGDETFLREVYGGTRQEELEAAGFPVAMRGAFLDSQFRAQQQGYHSNFPRAEFQIILRHGNPIGRMVINRGAVEWSLVDIALLPAHRNRGIGTALIQKLSAEAEAAGLPLRLFVIRGQPAFRLYQRLGFVKIGESGLHDLMEWRSRKSPPKINATHAL